MIIITTGRNDHLFVCTYRKINNEFAFYPQYFLGVLNISSTFANSILWVLEIDMLTTDLLLRKYTQHKTLTPYDMYDFENSVTLRPPG